MATSPLAVQSLRVQLFANGFPFVPVMNGDKRPAGKQWPQRARALTAESAAAYPDGSALSTGIIADGLAPLDYDCEDAELGAWIVELAQQKLGWAPIRYRANSAKWLMLYRSTEQTIRSSNVSNADGKQILEVLGQGRQFVAHGVHPSGATYEWSQEPKALLRNSLTAVSPEQLAEFLECVAQRIGGNASRVRQHDAEFPVNTNAPIPSEAEQRIAASVLSKLCGEMRVMQAGGRNKALNDAALQLGELCAGWGVDREPIAQALLQSSSDNGLTSADGLESVKATIASGFSKGLTQPRARHVELPLIDISNLRVGGKLVSDAPGRPQRAQQPKAAFAKPSAPRGVTLRNCAEIRMEPVSWHWDGYLPAGLLTLLCGAGGTGKSTLAFSFAATVTTGGVWPDGTRCVQRGNVLIWSSEDDVSRTIVPRLMAAGADLNMVSIIEGPPDEHGFKQAFDPATDMQGLTDAVRQMHGISLLIIDPIVSAVQGDMNKANDVRRSLDPFVRFAEDFGCAVVGISHFAKNTNGRNATERVIGSQAFAAVARMVLVTAKEDDTEERVFTRTKTNISENGGGFSYSIQASTVLAGDGRMIPTTRVVWGAALQGSAKGILNDVEGDDAPHTGRKIDDAVKFLLGALQKGPVAANDVTEQASAAGISKQTLRRARESINIVPRKADFGGQWMWALQSHSITPLGWVRENQK